MNASEQPAAGLDAAPAPDLYDAPLKDVMRYIVAKHHAYLRAELPLLSDLVAKAVAAESRLQPLAGVYVCIREELEAHMMKEENLLFPLITGIEEADQEGAELPPAHCGSVNNPIHVMEYEHVSVKRALAEMRRITRNYESRTGANEACRTLYGELKAFEQDLHQHIHLEDDIVFPRASALESKLA